MHLHIPEPAVSISRSSVMAIHKNQVHSAAGVELTHRDGKVDPVSKITGCILRTNLDSP